jgi:hypothetical protein
MSVLACADEADRRHIRFLAVVEIEFAPSSARVEILPAHEAPSAHRLARDRRRFDLLANKIRGKHRHNDVARKFARSGVASRKKSLDFQN